MGALTNIYCIPRAPGAVGWARVMTTLADQALVRAPFRAGAPFGDEERSTICWPENWLVPQTLRPSSLELPLRDEILWIHGKCVPPEEDFLVRLFTGRFRSFGQRTSFLATHFHKGLVRWGTVGARQPLPQ